MLLLKDTCYFIIIWPLPTVPHHHHSLISFHTDFFSQSQVHLSCPHYVTHVESFTQNANTKLFFCLNIISTKRSSLILSTSIFPSVLKKNLPLLPRELHPSSPHKNISWLSHVTCFDQWSINGTEMCPFQVEALRAGTLFSILSFFPPWDLESMCQGCHTCQSGTLITMMNRICGSGFRVEQWAVRKLLTRFVRIGILVLSLWNTKGNCMHGNLESKYVLTNIILGFPGDSVVKNLPTKQAMRVQSLSWEDPQSRKWQPTPVFLPEKSHRQRSLVGYNSWGNRESDTT